MPETGKGKRILLQDCHLLNRGFACTLIRKSDQLGVFISEKSSQLRCGDIEIYCMFCHLGTIFTSERNNHVTYFIAILLDNLRRFQQDYQSN